MPLTIKDLMDRMPGAFLPEKAQGVNAVIQFQFAGEQAGDWKVSIKDGACLAEQGTAENPTLVLAAAGQDYIDMITGRLDPMQAFMQGKVKLKGDLNLAMKMMGYFKLDRE